jgi:hypothetical protein
MTARTKWGAGSVAVASIALFLLAGLSSAETQRTTPGIGAGYIKLTEDHVFQRGFTLGAFVRTGSGSNKCLVTLSESDFAVQGTTVYCGVRKVHGELGIFVHVFLPQEAPKNFFMTMTVYQTGAQGYGKPVPFERF